MALTSSMNWGINLFISLTFLTVTGKDTSFSSKVCARRTNGREARSRRKTFGCGHLPAHPKENGEDPDVASTQLKQGSIVIHL